MPELLGRDQWSAYQDLAALLPDARHRIATESDHYIQVEQPDLVTGAIGDVVEAVRDPAPWRNPTSSQ